MAITGATKQAHSHGSWFYGRTAPQNYAGQTPASGSMWLVSDLISVTVGAPSVFSPAALLPPTLADLQALGSLGQGAAWQPGDYLLLGDGSQASWDGNQWVQGTATVPLATQAFAAMPGSFGPVGHRPPTTKAELDTINPGVAWGVVGTWVSVGGNEYYWDGNSWQAGRVPAPAAVVSATVGAPGQFIDANGLVVPQGDPRYPFDPLALIGGKVAANPTRAWGVNEYVVLGDGTFSYWTGAFWHNGRILPLATNVTPGAPGIFGPAGSELPTTKVQLDTIVGGAAWTSPGQYVSIGPLPSDEYHWNGATWVQGRVPGVAIGNAQFQTTPVQSPAPGPVSSALPVEIQWGVYAGPSFSMRWNQVDASSLGGVDHIILTFMNSSGTQLWRSTMAGARSDMTTGITMAQIPPPGGYIFLEYHYGNGTVQSVRAQVT